MKLLLLENPGDEFLCNYSLLNGADVYPLYLTLGKQTKNDSIRINEITNLMTYFNFSEDQFGILDLKYDNIDKGRFKTIVEKFIEEKKILEVYCPLKLKGILEFENVFYYNTDYKTDEFETDDIVKRTELTMALWEQKKSYANIYFSQRGALRNLLENSYFKVERYRKEKNKEEESTSSS